VNPGWLTYLLSDPSATTSGFTGLSYIGIGAQRSIDSTSCAGIAVATSNGIANGVFDYDRGVACIVAPAANGVDGPDIKYDLGGTDLYEADTRGDGTHLTIMRNCQALQPGCCSNDGAVCAVDTLCLRTSTRQCPVTGTDIIAIGQQDQPTVTVNPCSHNVAIAYKLWMNDEIHLQFRTPSRHVQRPARSNADAVISNAISISASACRIPTRP